MTLTPTLYVDDDGKVYLPREVSKVKDRKLYGMYHEKGVQSIADELQALKTEGITLIAPQGALWTVLNDVRANGLKALEGWEVHLRGEWSPIISTSNGQFNLNGNLEYRRSKNGTTT